MASTVEGIDHPGCLFDHLVGQLFELPDRFIASVPIRLRNLTSEVESKICPLWKVLNQLKHCQ